jgi:molybdopterin-guanine dinucleotide biosynthesis protein A
MPYVTADLYRYLYARLVERTGIKEYKSNPFELYDGAVAVTGGRIHPLAGVYSVGAAGICKTQLEERKFRLREALGKLRILYVDLEGTAYERMLLNINTEEDYKEYITGRSRST